MNRMTTTLWLKISKHFSLLIILFYWILLKGKCVQIKQYCVSVNLKLLPIYSPFFLSFAPQFCHFYKYFKCVFMCSGGLANPGHAFTVFYGERNPWCEYEAQRVDGAVVSNQCLTSSRRKKKTRKSLNERRYSVFQGLRSTAQDVQVMAPGLWKILLLRNW